MDIKYWRYYLAEILRGFWLTMPVTTIFYLSLNRTFAEIGIAEAILAAIVFFAEIPTGILSDKIGHKIVSSSGFFLCGLATLLIAFYGDLTHFLIAFAVWGLAEALISGAYSSLLYEHVRYLRGEYKKVALETSFLRGVSILVASLLGAYLFTVRPNIPFIVYGFILIALSVLLLTIKYRSMHTYSRNILRLSFDELKRVKTKRLIIYTVAIFAVFQVLGLLIQRPILVERGFRASDLGWLMGIIMSIGWLSPYFLRRIRFNFSSLAVVAMITGGVMFVANYAAGFLLLAILVLARIGRDIQEQVTGIMLHNAISSKTRATVLSIQSSLMNIGSSILVLAAGFTIQNTSLGLSFAGLGCVLAVIGVYYALRPIRLNLAQ